MVELGSAGRQAVVGGQRPPVVVLHHRLVWGAGKDQAGAEGTGAVLMSETVCG